MLIFSVSFQFFRMSPRRGQQVYLRVTGHSTDFCILFKARVSHVLYITAYSSEYPALQFHAKVHVEGLILRR